MGLFSWLRRRRTPTESLIQAPSTQPAIQPPVQVLSPTPPLSAAFGSGGFVVFDVETTGLDPARDRIVEIGVICTDPFGRIVEEWTTLVNPGGPVGATRVHGISAADVRWAPRFGDVVGELTARLAGRALVAHNARFDLAFIQAEYARAGWPLPPAPYLCTFEASRTYLPDLSRRRLTDCCWALGISLHNAHSALDDARATAMLLASFLDHNVGRPPLKEHLQLPAEAAGVAWPPIPRQQVAAVRRAVRDDVEVPAPPGILWALLDALPLSTVVEEGAPEIATPYLELLYEALEDGVLTEAEAQSLTEVAKVYSLTRQQVDSTHRAFLLALAHRIVEDGKVTRDERSVLRGAAKALGFSDELPNRVLDEARAALEEQRGRAARPLADSWPHGEPLRIGQAVAFTGCDPLVRARLEGRAQAAGLRVTGSVSRVTAVLVTDGANPTTAKAVAARHYGTRIVTPDVFAELAEYVQPSSSGPASSASNVPAQRDPATLSAAGAADATSTVDDDPVLVRAWARENGLPVAVRGRVPRQVYDAYRAAKGAGGTTP